MCLVLQIAITFPVMTVAPILLTLTMTRSLSDIFIPCHEFTMNIMSSTVYESNIHSASKLNRPTQLLN